MIPADRCKVPAAFWRAVAQIGIPPAALLRQARLPATLHLEGQSLVTTAQFFAIWRALEALADEPALGIRFVAGAATAAHPPSSLAAFHARDYRDGLHRLARFKRLCTPEQFHIVEGAGECLITNAWFYATEPEPAIATDVAFATLVELGRRGTGLHLTPLRLDLQRPGPGHDAHRQYFGCEIRYGAPRNALLLKGADLDRPFPGHNPELLDMLTPSLASALGELEARSSLCAQVKIVLKRSLASGRPELADVARELGTSERTLQRRITEEGRTFREMLVEARQELGRQLLADPATDIDEVACLLGYQDTSSFYRAFRDWEGVTPSRWRELNGRGGAGPGRPHALH
ncbi:AraC family transcriptional regulator [Methylobacterium organophilum]|uniref:HTH-type transcriptional regulator VirS n=1 Tax=Methylobacterium organophilum TaxID=410 RepID=A0ABQ4TAA8_METOR|nr:AraC family transcriptional regulator [Methylobacterium organophilum]GJE28163.1 HTH-type transcriptional regulator VirS [Methylobacterium organophilum]